MPSITPNGHMSSSMFDSTDSNGSFNQPDYASSSKLKPRQITTQEGIVSPTAKDSSPHTMHDSMAASSSSLLNARPSSINTSSAFGEMANQHSFGDLIKKGQQARAEDMRTVYETKKAKVEADRENSRRLRSARDNAIRELALESRLRIDADKEEIFNEMEKNLKALVEAEFRAEIREKVYADEQKISQAYKREIEDLMRAQLEKDLEPVIVAELSVKLEDEVKEALKVQLEDGVKETLKDELEDIVRDELQAEYREEVRSELKRELKPSVREELLGSLGISNIAGLPDQQPTNPGRSNTTHFDFNADFQGFDEDGEEEFDDAPEHSGLSLGAANDLPDHDLATKDLPQTTGDVDQNRFGATYTGSPPFKRHIDENYDDDTDEDEHMDADSRAGKRVKLSPQQDLRADEASDLVHEHVEKEVDNVSVVRDDSSNHADNSFHTHDGENGDEIPSLSNTNTSASDGAEVSDRVGELEGDVNYPVLKVKQEILEADEQGLGAVYHDQVVEVEGEDYFLNDFEYPEPGRIKQEMLDEDEQGLDDTDEEVDVDDPEDDDHAGSFYGTSHQPFGNFYSADDSLANAGEGPVSEDATGVYDQAGDSFGNDYDYHQLNEAPHGHSQGTKRSRSGSQSEEDEEDYETELEEEARASKRLRGGMYLQNGEDFLEADSTDEEESVSDDMDIEDTQGPCAGEQNAQAQSYGLIKQTNTQETAFVIDDSDDDKDSPAVEDESTLIGADDSLPISKRVQDDEESLFVTA